MAMIDSIEARAALCGLPQSTDGMVPLSAALRALTALTALASTSAAPVMEIPAPRPQAAQHLVGARVPGI